MRTNTGYATKEAEAFLIIDLLKWASFVESLEISSLLELTSIDFDGRNKAPLKEQREELTDWP